MAVVAAHELEHLRPCSSPSAAVLGLCTHEKDARCLPLSSTKNGAEGLSITTEQQHALLPCTGAAHHSGQSQPPQVARRTRQVTGMEGEGMIARTLSRPVKARMRRSTERQASVPLLTKRTISMEGTRSITTLASTFSSAQGAPYDVPCSTATVMKGVLYSSEHPING